MKNPLQMQQILKQVQQFQEQLQKQLESKDLGAHSDQLTVEKSLPIAGLQPGKYRVTVKINDAISKQEIAQSVPFVVE